MAKRKPTKKQLEALAKGRAKSQHSSKRRGKRRSLLSGLGDMAIPKWNNIQVMSAFEKAGLFLVGYVGGKEIDRRFIKSGDQEGFKKFIGPVITAGGGVILSNMKGDAMRYIGYGLLTAGAVSGINNALGNGKDITNLETLKGFSLGDVLSGKAELPVYREPIMLKLPPYRPSLPDLDSAERTLESSLEDVSMDTELNGDDYEATIL